MTKDFTIWLRSKEAVAKAHEAVDRAASHQGYSVVFRPPRRSLEQNDRMWAHLTDIARQHEWHGAKRSKEDWKIIFIAALKQTRGEELETVPTISGKGMVFLGGSSSELSVKDMTDLITIMEHFAAVHEIELRDKR